MSVSKESMLRTLKQRDAARQAYRASGIAQDKRLADLEVAYLQAKARYNEVQREKRWAMVGLALACSTLGFVWRLSPWEVVALFGGGVGVVKLMTL